MVKMLLMNRNSFLKDFLAAACLLITFAALAEFETEEPVDFTLARLGGGEVSLSDFLGQWVVVNYWATWCAPCIKEMPELSALHEENKNMVVLGLAFEDVDDADFDDAEIEIRGRVRSAGE